MCRTTRRIGRTSRRRTARNSRTAVTTEISAEVLETLKISSDRLNELRQQVAAQAKDAATLLI